MLARSMEESTKQQEELQNRLDHANARIASIQSGKEEVMRSMQEMCHVQNKVQEHMADFRAKLQAEKDDLMTSLKASADHQKDLEGRLDKSDALVANLRSDNAILARLVEGSANQSELENRLASSDAIVANLRSEKERLLRSIEGPGSEQQELKNRLAGAIMNKVRATESLRTAERKLLNAKQVNGSLQGELKNLQERISELESELRSARHSKKAAGSEKKMLQRKLSDAEKTNSKLRARVLRVENAKTSLTKERDGVNADILTNLDLGHLNSMDAGSLRNLLCASLKGGWEAIMGRNDMSKSVNSIEGQAQCCGHTPVGVRTETPKDEEARRAISPPSVVPRKTTTCEAFGNLNQSAEKNLSDWTTRSENRSPSIVGRVSEVSIFEEEQSVSSGTGSRFSESMQNMDIDVAGFDKDTKPSSDTQPTKDAVSKFQPRRVEEGGNSDDEPQLLDESAGIAAPGSQRSSKDSANYVIENAAYEALTSMRTISKKRKRLEDDEPHIPKPPAQSDGIIPFLEAPKIMLPKTGHCQWSYDHKSRVLLANFRSTTGKISVTHEDEAFLFHMMERDDITVISEGLADEISPSLWTREYIEGCIGSEYHHKVRVFETISKKNGLGRKTTELKEKSGWYSMKVSDYFQYLEQKRSVKSGSGKSGSNTFSFTDSEGKERVVNVDKESLYMLDVDMVKLLPQLFEDVKHNFKLPGILPGGTHCMMNAVNVNGRPFMGPNLYISPPSSFTHFHHDGHGTVDSGHLCLSGYNEVIMLRRLTEKEKCRALRILTGTSDPHSTLYGFPHQDDVETLLGWPNKEAIRQCEKLGFCPSVFILKAGQVLHVNKGRMHAFRKLAPSKLCKTDCHFDLRNDVLKAKVQPTKDICFSIAWDWMYKGVTCDGINREVSGILECARLNREHELPSLAIPETSLLFLAKQSIAKHQLGSKIGAANSLFEMDIPQKSKQRERSEPDAETVLRGILPSLASVVRSHKSAAKRYERNKTGNKLLSVSINSLPNTLEDPESSMIDPYGADDFSCKVCGEELSNVYMHCDGCEKLLNQDYNICCKCHKEGKHNVFHQVNPFIDKQESMLNHTGNMMGTQKTNCCGQVCAICSFCTGCSCKCHQSFTLHYRFMGLQAEEELLENAKSIVCSARK